MSLSTLPRVCRHAVAIMWTRHPFLFLSGVLLLSFCCFAWLCYGRGDEKTPTLHLWRSQRLFADQGRVFDISNGSLETLSRLLKSAEIKFVLFYAPWCGQSRRIATEFSHAAHLLYHEVSFIAVNCWLGSCKENHVLDSFPKLFAYHTKFTGLEYVNEGKSWKFVQFLKTIMRPLIYIGNQKELQEFQRTNEDIVMGYFTPDLLNSQNYSKYFGAALHSHSRVPNARYGLITSQQVAESAGLTSSGQIILQRYSSQKQVYPVDSNFTVHNITQWVEKNISVKRLVIELSPSETNSKYISEQLNRGPAVVLFLPLKQRKTSRSLLSLIKNLAFDYHNCSCSSSDSSSATDAVFEVEQDEMRGAASPVKSILSAVQSAGVGITKSQVMETFLLKQATTCLSIPLDYHSKNGNNRNVCDICHSCVKDCSYEDNVLLQNLKPRILRAVNQLASRCNSFRTSYYNRFTTSVCCSSIDQGHLFTQKSENRFDSFKVIDSEFGGYINRLIDKVLKTISPSSEEAKDIFIASSKSETKNVGVPVNDTKNIQAQPGTPHQDSQRKFPLATDIPSKDACNRTGHVTEFRHAGCHSNRSVNFFYMDSGRYWSIAEKLGVLSGTTPKFALVIVDSKNEAQYVLNETTKITNHSVVDFVMGFMNGSLERRLRSSSLQSQEKPYTCPLTHACVVEVTSASFHSIVVNNSKDVLLMFYAPWCGYCRAVYPVYLGLARVFKHVKNLVIARIDADENDLPWELTVTEYPTFILFPAKRKDYSVTYPKSRERTIEGFLDFVLSHASETTRRSYYGEKNEECAENLERAQIFKLQLQEAEETTRLTQIRLDKAIKSKQVAEHKHALAAKDLKTARMEASRERERRLELENENRELLDSLISTEKKLWIESAENARLHLQIEKFENQIMDIHFKIHQARQRTEKISRERRRLLASFQKANSDKLIIQKLTRELRNVRSKLDDSEAARKLTYDLLETEKQARLREMESSELLEKEKMELQGELQATTHKIRVLEKSLSSLKEELLNGEKNELLEVSERTTRHDLKEVRDNHLGFTNQTNNLEMANKRPVR